MNIKKLLMSVPFLFISASADAYEPPIPVLEELHYTRQTTAMCPYYSIVRDGDGYLCRISPNKDKLVDRYSEVKVSSKEIRNLLYRLLRVGVLSWDGFNQSVPQPTGMLDGDDNFSFSMKLRYCHEVQAQGSRARPQGFSEGERILLEFFRTHQDYSRYYPRKFPAKSPWRVEILVAPEFGSQYTQLFKLSLSTSWKQWAVVLRDPRGEYLPKDLSVSDYRNGVENLPIEKCLALLKKYGFETKNGTRVKDGRHHSRVNITIHWDDELEYTFNSNADFDGREEFIREFLDMTMAYYETARDR